MQIWDAAFSRPGDAAICIAHLEEVSGDCG
jgi:hypothetical protein